MNKDDTYLPDEMGKLEIEPPKTSLNKSRDNPFNSNNLKMHLSGKCYLKSKCACCPHKKGDITIPIFKRKSNKVLKEPTLKVLQYCSDQSLCRTLKKNCSKELCEKPRELNSESILSSLVNEQLKISLKSQTTPNILVVNEISKRDVHQSFVKKEYNDNSVASCSQQALNPPCDVTIDELASYFETLVHIPKKMSSMAEMMYI